MEPVETAPLRRSERVEIIGKKGRDCEARWGVGVPNKPLDDIYPVLFKSSTNCKYTVGDKIIYIEYPKNRQAIVDIVNSIEPIDENALFTAPLGVYTWMFYKKKDDPKTYFAAARVKSIIEMGTLHLGIARRVGAVTVHGAGELIINKGGTISINFLSGTFMDKWLPKKGALCTLSEMETLLRDEYFKPMFSKIIQTYPRFRKSINFTKESLITNYFIQSPPTMEELQSYADKGFIICVHPKDKKDECLSVKGSCAAP